MICLIPTHRRPALLDRTLTSLAECDFPKSFSHVRVIENGGRHGAEQVCARTDARLNCRYLYCKEGNKSTALNVALEDVRQGLVVFLDDDVRVVPNLLRSYESAAMDDERGVFFGGPTGVDYESEPPPEWMRRFFPPSAFPWSLPAETTTVLAPEFMGYNWAAFAEDLWKCQGFNPTVGPGGTSGSTGQETDMQSRLLAEGITGRFVPNAYVWHYVSADQCTRDWILRRAFRHAVYEGLNYSGDATEVCGVPRWLWRMWLSRGFRAISSSFGGSPERRLAAWYEFHNLRGIMHGCRVSAKSRRAGPPSLPAVKETIPK